MTERETHRESALLQEIRALEWPETEEQAREILNLSLWSRVEEVRRTSRAKHAANAFSERLFRQFPQLLDEIPDVSKPARDGSRFVGRAEDIVFTDKWGVVKWSWGKANPKQEQELARTKRELGVSDDE